MPLPEDTILENRYRIDRLLAHGGMGAIYRGFDKNLDIPVAIKENFFQTPQSIRQFEQEARILARLHHPNLPRVIDHFTADGQQYLVMDYIEGTDLWETVKSQKQPLEEKQALNYLIQVCDAVSYLHQYDPPIIHRDIKPQNIKVTPNGRAMLVDFGIAKMTKDDSRTSTGARGITPGFSPPEQYSGSGTTTASDIYSLGATLYALLTGKKPPDSVSLLVNQASFEPPDKLNDKLSPQVCRAIMQAMQSQTQDRPQSVADWQQQLQAIVDDTVLHEEGDTDVAPTMLSISPPQPAPEKKPIWRRRPWVWVGIGLFLCICVSLAVVGGDKARSTDRIAFTSDRDGGQELYVRNPDGAVIRMTNNSSDEDDAAWSPDGSKLAFASDRDGNWEIYVIDETGEVQRMTNHPAEDRDPVWSPDGSTLAFASDRNDNWDIFVLDAEGLRQMTTNSSDDRDPVWSPDNAKMAFASNRYDNYEIFVIDDTGALNRMTNHPAEDRDPIWSPNGQVLAFTSNREDDWDIFKLEADGLLQLTDDSADDLSPVWSSDNKKITFTSDRDGSWDIFMMSADGSEQTNLTNNRADDTNPAWIP